MKILTLLVCLLCAHTSDAATYFVSTSGNDSSPGSSAQPWRTLARAVPALGAGDTLLVQPGTYAEVLDNLLPSGSSWSQPVTIRAANPASKPVLRPPSGSNFGLRIQAVHHVIIDGFVIDGVNAAYDAVKITQANTTDIRIQNTEIKNGQRQGILLTDGATRIELINLDVHHNGHSDFDHGIYLATDHVLISGSRIYNNSGWGVHLYKEGSTTGVSDNVIANNVIYDNAALGLRGEGIILSSGARNTAYNNIVRGNKVGIWVDYGAVDTTVYHNTVVNNRGEYAIRVLGSASRTVVRNNIAFANANNQILNQGSGSVISHNLVSVDPRFVSSSGGDFRLLPGSPAIDAGYNTGAIATDMFGVNRDTTPDIGAAEMPRAAQVPGVPVGVSASASGTTITVQWSAPVSGTTPTGYLLDVGTSAGASNIASGLAVGATFSYSAVLAPGTYFTRVRAQAGSGVSASSIEVAAEIVAAPTASAPSKPRSLAGSFSRGTATLTWQQPASGGAVQQYLVDVGTRSGASNVLKDYSVGQVRTMSGALAKGVYYVRVRAQNAAGKSAASNEIVLSTKANASGPSSPRSLTSVVNGANVTLSWEAPLDAISAVDYVLDVGSTPGGSDLLAGLPVGGAQTITAAVPAGVYFARVRAVTTSDVGDPSDETVFAVGVAAPAPPTLVQSTSGGSTVTLSWARPLGAGAVAGYMLEVGTQPGASDVGIVALGDITELVTPPVPAGTYFVRLRAINGLGSSDPSNELTITR